MNNALSKAVNRFSGFIVRKSPTILLVLGIGGCVSATVIAIKETPKAVRLVEKRKEELKTEKLDVKETVRTTWKLYLPVVVTGTLSIACIIFSHSINERRKAALATAYTIAETAMVEYRDKVKKELGEEKEFRIREKVNDVIEDRFGEDLDSLDHASNYSADAKIWILEPVTGQIFFDSENHVREVINDLNEEMMDGCTMSIDVNDYLFALGLNPSKVFGDREWHIHNSGIIRVRFPDYIKDKDGKPLLVMELRTFPRDRLKYGD